jgi:beta-glucosidase
VLRRYGHPTVMSFIPTPLRFPKDFSWGVATSAFQIEGAATADGKGASIWDRFCEKPGAIADASNGLVACDHYHRWRGDLDLIASLGVDCYRFSIAWPRVQPLGSGAWNDGGLDFYDRLVDGLLERGISPHVTLNHWDLPAALQEQGGWAHRDTVHRFVDYALRMQRLLGNRAAGITTHNEPWVIAELGHRTGIFAPGIQDAKVCNQVIHHLLLSHGLALRALRQDGCRTPLGIVLNLAPVHPASDSEADRAKARLEDGQLLRWYMDPLCLARYPEDVWAARGNTVPDMAPDDLAAIAQPLDFLGVNYYMRSVASAGEPWDPKGKGLETTDMGWEVYPQGLDELLQRLHRDYRVPALYVTENGAAYPDQLHGGHVPDTARVSYLQRHIAAVAASIEAGVPVRGYMVWSLMDNFEWASGYTKRFGIVHVDYPTQRRTLKDSALWYREFVREQRGR